jgi:diguanylate cyclase (GGDEF)-like protein
MNFEILQQTRILYVDDDVQVCNSIASALNDLGTDIVVAQNTKEALDIFLKYGDFDMLITDIEMPDKSGIELINEIRKFDYTLPVTVVSAHSDTQYLFDANNLGVNGYLIKPIDLKQLAAQIKKVVEPRILRKQLENFNHNLIDQLNERTYELNTIINTQENLIAVSTKDEIHTLNLSFLEFLGINSLNSKNNKLENLFDLFEKSDDYFYFKNEKTIEECLMQTMQHVDDLFVQMKDKFEKTHIFKLQTNKYEHKNIEHFVFSFTDITEIKKTSDFFRHKATHDGLTALHNRQYFSELLTNEIHRSKRYNTPFVLVMFDIDHFKQINDSYGHDVGDEVLVNLSSFVKNSLRNTDIFARWGGEEFMILLPETSIENTQEKIEQLRINIANTQLSKQIKNPITVSFGITLFNPKDTKGTLLKRVDVALYNAKAFGRNRLEIL